MRLLVTGGSGFVGQAVVCEAIGRGATVGLLARDDGRQSKAHETFVLGRAPWERSAIEDAVARFEPDAILHLAGGPSAERIEALFESNVFLAERLLDAARKAAPAARTVVVGSAAEYGLPTREDGMVAEGDSARPLHAYGIAKLAQTLHALAIARGHGQSVVVARLFNPVGPGMPSGLVFSDVARQIAAGSTMLRMGNIDTARDFMPVWEAARILVDLVEHPDASGIVNVCSGRPQIVREGINQMVAAAGRTIEFEFDERLGASGGGVPSIFGDTRRLRALGIEPASSDLGTALRRVVQASA